jgi:Protein of unknown function (DUF3833)
MKHVRALMILVLCAVLAGCSTPTVERYAAERPALRIADYFNGPVQAYGFFRDRSGTVVKRFTVDMQCTWNGSEGVLDERFVYSDGSTQRRVWRLTLAPDGTLQGRADDVVGTATGKVSGNALRLNYTLRLPVGDDVYEVQMDDWMYLQNDRVMLNTATMRKFGIKVGEVVLTFIKP